MVLAERVGFEPTVPYGTLVFKTSPFDHSGTSPRRDAGAVETAAGGDRAAPLARSGAGRKRVDVVRCDFRIR